MVLATMGNQRQALIVPPTLPPVEMKNNNDAHGQREEEASKQRGEGKTEESDGERGQFNSETDGLI